MQNKAYSGRGRRGASLILFTTMLSTLLVPLVGLAIDCSMLYIVQAKLSCAVDGAALGAGRLLGTPANTAEIAGEFLNANFPAGYWRSYNFTPNISVSQTFSSHTISIKATVDVPLLFLRVFRQDHQTVAASAVATRKETRVVLALDRSGSMSTQIGALRTASTNFANLFIPNVDELGLVAYGSSAVVAYPTTRPYNISPTSNGGPDVNWKTTQPNGNLLDMIGYMASSGATNMSEALWLSYIELQKGDHRDHDPSKLNAIVLFTDGVPTAFSANLNDPSNLPDSSVLLPKGNYTGQSKCTYNPGTAGNLATQMIGWIGGWGIPSSTGYVSGLYRLASDADDVNSAKYWMQTPAADMNKISPTTPITNCVHLQATQSDGDLDDLRRLPPQDLYGNSTSEGTVYQNSKLYAKFHTNYDPTNLNSGYHLGIAAFNAVDNAAQRILADTNLNVAIYVIAYVGGDGVDTYLLKRVANTMDSSNYHATWQKGLYQEASDAAGLQRAFLSVASEILRLAQ